MLMFSFSEAVSLDSLSIGWWSNDSDMTVLAYTGESASGINLAGKSWAQSITPDNWTGGNLYDVAQHGGTVATNPKAVTSTNWLVGTLLQPIKNLFASLNTPAGSHRGSDYVKLSSINVSRVESVPEIDGGQAGLAFGLLAAFVACLRERRRAAV